MDVIGCFWSHATLLIIFKCFRWEKKETFYADFSFLFIYIFLIENFTSVMAMSLLGLYGWNGMGKYLKISIKIWSFYEIELFEVLGIL